MDNFWRYNFCFEIKRRLRVANLDDIIKIATMFTRTTFKDSKKYISVFLDMKNITDILWKNVDVSWTQKVCQVIDIFSESF